MKYATNLRTTCTAHMQYLSFCLENKIISKGLKLKKPLSVSKSTNGNADVENLRIKWNKILNKASVELTRALRNYYGKISNGIMYPLNQELYNQIIWNKVKKLSKLTRRNVHPIELARIQFHPNRKYTLKTRKRSNKYNLNSVINLSKYTPTANELNLLNLGLDFNISKREFCRYDLLKGISNTSKKCFEANKHADNNKTITQEMSSKMFDIYLQMQPNYNCVRNVTKELMKAATNLASNENVLIVKADKGKQAVLWERDDYIVEAQKHLGSPSYEKCDLNAVKVAVNNVSTLVMKYLGKNVIDKDTANKLYVYVKTVQRRQFELDPRARHTFFSLMIGNVFLTISNFCLNQMQMQRYLSVKSNKKVDQAVVLNICGNVFCTSLLVFLGMVIYSSYSECDPILGKRIYSSFNLLPLFVRDSFGNIPGLAGVFLATICSGAMSSVSSILNSLASLVVYDLIKPFTNTSFDRWVLVLRAITVLIGCLALLCVPIIKQYVTILEAVLSIIGLFGGPNCALFLLGFLFPFVQWKAALSGYTVSMIFQMWLFIGTQLNSRVIRTPSKHLNTFACSNLNATRYVKTGGPTSLNGVLGFYAISYLWHTLTGVLCCMIVALIVSFVLGDYKNETKDEHLYIRVFSKKTDAVESKINTSDSKHINIQNF
ncbi:hypothetical protein GJ496_006524 [Pomphorhynchus laevis]|nr:hypothetical protein GJ496_006524 [Pomphorhynchus laevis]